MKLWLAVFFSAAVLQSPLASSHHSYSAWSPEFVTLNGTVKEFQWTNPHVWIQVLVAAPDGQLTEWGVESAAPGMLHRFGWKSASVKAGDKVAITFHPKRDGSKTGSLVKVVMPDKSVLEVRDLVVGAPPQEPRSGLTGESSSPEVAPK